MRQFAILAAVSLPSVVEALTTKADLSPVTRVVELLKDLSAKVEKDGKTEEALFEKYVCWGKTNVAEKKASNEKASARIETLTTYIADIDAGRIEFTSERVDLEKELEQVNSDIEAATELRGKEKSDFEDAEDEMKKAIKALTAAKTVLAEATKDQKTGTLLALKGELRSTAGFAARVEQGAHLAYAVELGDKFLTRGDALFLRRLLMTDVEVPKPDWKKLNRKAGFKMSYKARSFKIQDVLAKMLQTFQSNLDDATKKEQQAQADFDKLSSAKTAQKTAAEEALAKMEAESGAAGMGRSEAEDEVTALKAQVTADTAFIKQIEASVATKTEQWSARSTLRAGELGAISKAISILASDDAKDLLKKSMSSQGASFLQEFSSSRRKAAANALSIANAGDQRIIALATRMASKGHFDEVVGSIDKMIALLKEEEKKELAKKEQCEEDRMSDTRSAIVASRAMDEMTETMNRLTTEIGNHQAEIKNKQAEIKGHEDALAGAKKQREEEAESYAADKKDDEDAAALVKSAQKVLEGFYTDNGLSLAQRKIAAPAGEAPPPPPSTWEGDYGGATGESNGISSMLGMIVADIQKDIAECDKEEQDAIASYKKVKATTEAAIKDLKQGITDLEGTTGQKERMVETNTKDRATKLGELNVVMQQISDAQPGCDYFTINYPLRLKNRQTEIDGLDKAKAILQGGKFA